MSLHLNNEKLWLQWTFWAEGKASSRSWGRIRRAVEKPIKQGRVLKESAEEQRP